MFFKKNTTVALVGYALAAMSFVASAQTLRISNQGDATSMDPHSLNESMQLSITGNVYEGLVGRNKDLSLAPALATKWSQPSPNVWRFELRKGVQFHDGTPFTADDVIFSFARASGDGSDMKSYTNDVKEVRKINDLTVEIDVLSAAYLGTVSWSELAAVGRVGGDAEAVARADDLFASRPLAWCGSFF